MSMFDDVKKLAQEHQDVVHNVLDKAEELVDEKTGGQYTEQIESAGQTAEDFLTGQ